MRVLPRDIEDELAVADDAGEVAVFRELEVDVALFPLGARLPGVDRRVRGDVALSSLLPTATPHNGPTWNFVFVLRPFRGPSSFLI